MPPEMRGGAPKPLGKTGFFAEGPDGQEITRPMNCALCGAEFQQRLLSERFMLAVEKRGPRAMAMLRNQIPDLWCPVYCPSCERLALAHEGREAEMRGAA